MGIKRSECSDSEFSAKLLKGYDEAVAAGHPAHEDYNKWRAVARGESVSEDGGDRDDESHMPDAGGATDAARRPWAKASEPVRLSLDAAMQPGRSATDSLALAEANLSHQGYSVNDGLFTELRTYAAATARKGARDSARRATQALKGYTRLR